MNLVTSRNLESISPAQLPTGIGGRLRLLTLGVSVLGLKTYAKELQDYCAVRDDVEAVHVFMAATPWLRARYMATALPWSPAFRSLRVTRVWESVTKRWCRPGGELDLRHFDAVLVCPQWYARGVAAIKAAGHDIPLGVILDATVKNTVRDMGDSPLMQRPHLAVERRVLKQCDAVGCMSSWAAQSVATDYGVDAARIVPMFPTAELVDLPLRGVAAPGQPLRMVFVGWDWVRKGGPQLLRWHQERWSEKAELHFVGGGEKVPAGAPPRNVFFHGKIERDTLLRKLLPSMDVFVMPTTRDMSPAAISEAMAAGLAVVSTRMAGIPDLVVEGETGFLAPVGDEAGYVRAIQRLIDNPVLCRRMGQAGRVRAEKELRRDIVYGRLIDRLKAVHAARRGPVIVAGPASSAV